VKILFTGDWQLSVNNLDRGQLIVDQILEIFESWPKEKKYFVHLGDIKELLNPVDQRVTNFIIDSWDRIQKVCSGTFFVRGNHDPITTQDGVPSITTLVKRLGAQVADDSWQRENLETGWRIWLVPYFRDSALQKTALETASIAARSDKTSRYKILAFHNEIHGCQLNAFVQGKGLVPADLGADAYTYCIGGHIHLPQQVEKNIWYAGSPYCCDWGEVNQEKGFLIIDANKPTPFRIPSCIPGWYDPKVPGFKPPSDWRGTRVRISVPVSLDPQKELAEAHQKLSRKYMGAFLKLVPEFQSLSVQPETVDLEGGDKVLLAKYLEKQPLPDFVRIEQLVTYLQKFLPSSGVLGVQGLHFRSVTAENVLPFRECRLNLDQKGLTLVTGINEDWSENISNGSGKSSLVSLPFIGLFGRTFKGQKDDEWARQDTEAPAKLELLLDLPDRTSLKIFRGRRKPLFRAFLGDREISMGDKNATQTMIEKLTNLTWDVLTNSVYIGQREVGSVFGTDKERKELFSRLLGLDRFLDAQEKLRKEALHRQRIVEEVEVEISRVVASITEASSGLEEIQNALKEAPTVDPKVLTNRERTITNLEADIRKMTRENEQLNPTLDKNQKEFEQLLFKATDWDTKANSYREQLEATMKVSGRCHVCGNKISVAVLESYQEELKSKINDAEAEAVSYESLQEKNRTIRRALLQKFQENTFNSEKLRKQVTIVQSEVSKLKEQAEARSRLENILQSKERRVRELERQKQIHDLARIGYLENKQFIDICINTVGRNGLPAYLCSVVAPQLNLAASRYSQIFSGGEIGIQFEISGGDIDIRVCNLHGGKLIKDQSAGEMRMAGIIAAFAFRDVLVPHNLLVLDEPGEGLDAVNATAFAKGLNQVISRFQHVIVITHNPNILANLEPDFHWEVTKRNGIATLKELL